MQIKHGATTALEKLRNLETFDDHLSGGVQCAAEEPMKQTLYHLLCYSFFLALAMGLFRGWPEPPQGPLANRIAYCIGALFPWALIFAGGEIIYRIRQRRRAANRDTAVLPVPETNKLNRP